MKKAFKARRREVMDDFPQYVKTVEYYVNELDELRESNYGYVRRTLGLDENEVILSMQRYQNTSGFRNLSGKKANVKEEIPEWLDLNEAKKMFKRLEELHRDPSTFPPYRFSDPELKDNVKTYYCDDLLWR